MAYLDHIARANNWNADDFRPLTIAGRGIGLVRLDNAERLAAFPDVFDMRPDCIDLAAGLDNFEARSAALATVVAALGDDGTIAGLRGELYPVMAQWGDAPLLQIERAACPWFGFRSWGVHLNGYVRKPDGLHMWVACRSRGKQTYPGLLDNMVAGGQPIGIGLMENVIKECAEEAAIPAELARAARAVATISYRHQFEGGVKPDQQFCYDLELPADFEPRPADGEVEGFELWPIGRVAMRVRDTSEFKFNCNLVIIDFLIRHGVIDAEGEPDYRALCAGLRVDGF